MQVKPLFNTFKSMSGLGTCGLGRGRSLLAASRPKFRRCFDPCAASPSERTGRAQARSGDYRSRPRLRDRRLPPSVKNNGIKLKNNNKINCIWQREFEVPSHQDGCLHQLEEGVYVNGAQWFSHECVWTRCRRLKDAAAVEEPEMGLDRGCVSNPARRTGLFLFMKF